MPPRWGWNSSTRRVSGTTCRLTWTKRTLKMQATWCRGSIRILKWAMQSPCSTCLSRKCGLGSKHSSSGVRGIGREVSRFLLLKQRLLKLYQTLWLWSICDGCSSLWRKPLPIHNRVNCSPRTAALNSQPWIVTDLWGCRMYNGHVPQLCKTNLKLDRYKISIAKSFPNQLMKVVKLESCSFCIGKRIWCFLYRCDFKKELFRKCYFSLLFIKVIL